MRAREFINEAEDKVEADIARALPLTYTYPDLTNQDPYKQYRFGLAIAAANSETEYTPQSKWGEKMIVSAYSTGEEEIIEKASKLAGEKKVQVSSKKSEEAVDVDKLSPVASNKKNKYGV